jgi:hypothetical protein
MRLSILDSGSRETLKGAVHGVTLCLAVLMWAYNAAAWLQRRQRHLAVNVLVYTALVLFEREHVKHHWATPAEKAVSAALLAAAAVATSAEEPQVQPKAA